MRFFQYTTIAVAGMIVPLHVALAAPRSFKELVDDLVGLLDLATVTLLALAVLYFFWSIVTQLWGYDGGDVEQRDKLNQTLFWGVLIIFIMVSIWGIISILQQTLVNGIGPTERDPNPQEQLLEV